MRNLTLLCILIFSINAFGQDCSDIKKDVDKFNGTITYLSPLSDDITFFKVIVNADTSYRMRLKTTGSTLNVKEKGVIVLLGDGGKIKWDDADIKAEPGDDSDWRYHAWVQITKKQIQQLSKSTITDFRLYIYDASVPESKQSEYKNFIACLLKQ